MRIFENCRELMSEMGRELNSYGQIVKPKHYQNKDISNDESMITKEIICQQYCLTSLKDVDYLFVYTKTKEWAEAELIERLSGKMINPGIAWELNKDMWEKFLVDNEFYLKGYAIDHPYYHEPRLFDYTYAERINYKYLDKLDSQLDNVIKLLKNDPILEKLYLVYTFRILIV